LYLSFSQTDFYVNYVTITKNYVIYFINVFIEKQNVLMLKLITKAGLTA
jgi:hypothetical protein